MLYIIFCLIIEVLFEKRYELTLKALQETIIYYSLIICDSDDGLLASFFQYPMKMQINDACKSVLPFI